MSKAMSYTICCYPECTVRYGEGVSLHCFPNPTKEMERFRLWFDKIGEQVLGSDYNYIFKNRRICHNHFEEVYCYSKNKLCRLAVPTLFGIDSKSATNTSSEALNEKHIDTTSTVLTDCNTRPQVETIFVIDPRSVPNTSSAALNNSDIEKPSTVHTESSKDVIIDDDDDDNEVDDNDNDDNDGDGIDDATPRYPDTSVETELDCLQAITETVKRAADIGARISTAGCTATNIETQSEEDSTATAHRRPTGLSSEKESPTSKELQLKTTVRKLKRQLARSKKMQRLYKLKIASVRRRAHSEVIDVLTKNMTNSAKIFFKMQLHQSRKKNKGRRYSLREKMWALNIYKRNPEGYRCLYGICTLPSPKTLQKMMRESRKSAG